MKKSSKKEVEPKKAAAKNEKEFESDFTRLCKKASDELVNSCDKDINNRSFFLIGGEIIDNGKRVRKCGGACGTEKSLMILLSTFLAEDENWKMRDLLQRAWSVAQMANK